MFTRTNSSFDKLLDKATSSLNLEPDWNSILTVCDYIRQGDIQSKYAFNAIKKRIYAPNPHTNLFAIQVLESCMKNCGSSFHQEVATRSFMEELRDLVKVTTNEKLRDKVLELLQAWSHAFRKDPNYRVIQDFFNVMKAEGYKFPVLKETDAMFEADSAPQWADGDCCHRCRVQFNLVQRKHHCRNCGQIFCAKCSSKQSIIPRFGMEKEVRVCDDCFEKLSKPPTEPKAKLPLTTNRGSPVKSASPSELQKPATPSKTEQELQEEEDLQIAIALSKSEAEIKEKNRSSSISYTGSVSDISSTRRERESRSFDNEMEKYLNREYWEAKIIDSNRSTSPAPSAPSPHYSTLSTKSTINNDDKSKISSANKQENGGESSDIDTFINNLKSALEIFVNRMKSNHLRGRPIANDTAVQSLFLNITNMHSQLLKHIQEQDDARIFYESLQDKLSQIRDARAALDALREEHQEKLRLEAEEADRQRQLQMAQKLEIMRKKKQEYLQYQRQMALQRIQEQEREMLLRQEQQKYLWHQQPPNPAATIPSPYHQPPINYSQPQVYNPPLLTSVIPQIAQSVSMAPPSSPSRPPFENQNPVTISQMYHPYNLTNMPRSSETPGIHMVAALPQSHPSVSQQHQPSQPPQPQPVLVTPMSSGYVIPQASLPSQEIMSENVGISQTNAYGSKIEQTANEQPLISFD